MKSYELQLTAEEARGLVSVLTFPCPVSDGVASLKRKAIALLTYVEAEEHAEEAKELYAEALEYGGGRQFPTA